MQSTILVIAVMAHLPALRDCTVLEATIHIESDNIHMTSFLERFKGFIAQSHRHEKDTGLADQYVQSNGTFKANYDFEENLLTVGTKYSLMLNDSSEAPGTKVSDVQIFITFRFKEDSKERIVLEDLQGGRTPRIGLDDRWTAPRPLEENYEKPTENKIIPETPELNILDGIVRTLVENVEPVIVAFIHIVINGVLGHVLTNAFDHLYHGQLTT